MAIRACCSSCGKAYSLADTLEGKKVRCKECGESFEVAEETPEKPRGARGKSRDDAIQAPPRAERAARTRDDDDDEEREEEERPRARRRRDDDEEEARPRRRRARANESGSPVWLWPVVIGAAVLFVIVFGASLLVVLKGTAPAPQGGVIGQVAPPPMENLNNAAPPVKRAVIAPRGKQAVVVPPIDPADIVQPAKTRVRLDVKDSEVRGVILNGPSSTRAAIHSWNLSAPGGMKQVYDIHDPAAPGRLCRIEFADLRPKQMDLSADGTRLAVLSSSTEPKVTVWSLPDGKVIVSEFQPYPKETDFRKRRDLIWISLLGPDRLLTICRQGQFDLWSLGDRKNVYSVPPPVPNVFLNVNGFGSSATNFMLSPDRKTLALFNKDGFNLHDTESGKLLSKTARLSDEGTLLNFWGVAFSPDGKALACYYFMNHKGKTQVGALARWSVPDGKRLSLALLPADIKWGGGMTWWGPNHVVLWDGNLFKGQLVEVARGAPGRVFEAKTTAKFVAHSQDGRVWCTTGELRQGPAFLSSFELPQQDLTRFPLETNPDRRWFVTPGALTLRSLCCVLRPQWLDLHALASGRSTQHRLQLN
jgi:hypothetical protein